MTITTQCRPGLAQSVKALLWASAATFLLGCAGGLEPPKPTDLGSNIALVGVRQAWTNQLGPIQLPLLAKASGTTVALAATDGLVALLDARTGQDLWRLNVGGPISAAAGSDGRYVAVVTQNNELVALESGRELWRQKLTASTFTAPLVAGARVFVLSADRSVVAFDVASGRKLWNQTRPSEPLVLRQGGLLLAMGDTLIAGLSGRLVAMNPANGSSRWEVPIAVPRGTNDVERLVDLVGNASRLDDQLCVRAYQAAVGCVNTARGSSLWLKSAMGAQGVSGDDRYVYGTELDGKVVAWKRLDGERAWESDRLKYRSLTAPLAVGRSIAVGDNTGNVHLLSREDGSPLNRLTTDGSGIAAAPVLVGDTLVVVTRNGAVFGFRPE